MVYRSLVHLLGLLVAIVGLAMLAPLAWSIWFGDGQLLTWVVSSGACLGAGGGAWLLARRPNPEVYRKEGLAVVGLGWLLSGAFGALPFLLSGVLPDVHDAFFESLSGFTTTGSTVLRDIEAAGAAAPSVLFWRSLTHWLGGMGVIVLFLAVLPTLGAGGKQLFRSEVPGPVPEGLRPRIAETAAILWRLYVGLSAVLAILLLIEGMDLYEALIHTFGTLATGGFSNRNASVAAYDSVAIEVTIIVFMLLAGTNFTLYFRVLGGDWKAFVKDAEWRVYVGLLLLATAYIAVHLWAAGVVDSFGESLRQAGFQVVALTTTTGFGTADFELWPKATQVVLVALMFVGGSAGSTGGGMKVIRVMLLAKLALHEIRRGFAPAVIRQVRVGGRVVEPALRNGTLAYFALLLAIAVAATFLVALTGEDLVTSFTSVAATLNNIGPGLAKVGPMLNFAELEPFAKYVLSLCMVLGRLELYAILVLFVPSFWRR
jgi:trk system potassium uptake protein TrkH